ncbi:MAG: CPBP family intramembrane glutamic endopeptidase [Thermomicrobiales bacterium]
MTEIISSIIAFLIVIGAVWGLVYWAKRAEHDRSANVGLYLLFGIPGGLLTVAGLALSVNRLEAGPLVLGLGIALWLPLVKSFRYALARITPMDPESPIDMAGLACVLVVIAFTGLQYTITDTAPATSGDLTLSETLAALVSSFVAFVVIAYLCVGYRVWRTFREATARLGVTRLSARSVGIAVLAVIPAFVISMIGSALTVAFQPGYADSLRETVDQMTTGVQNPAGALILGFSTGVGEEILFRGAIQPRYGIVLASLTWTLLHAQYGLSFVLVGLFGIGILLGFIRKFMGTTAAMITHGLYNVIVVLLQTYLT